MKLQKNGESYIFNIFYDENGVIKRCGELKELQNHQEINTVEKYFNRDAARIDMSGSTVLVSK